MLPKNQTRLINGWPAARSPRNVAVELPRLCAVGIAERNSHRPGIIAISAVRPRICPQVIHRDKTDEHLSFACADVFGNLGQSLDLGLLVTRLFRLLD